jgi:hypothetical protein
MNGQQIYGKMLNISHKQNIIQNYRAIKKVGAGSVVHTYNPCCLRNRSRRIPVQGQHEQKLVRPYLKNKPNMLVPICDPSYSGGEGKSIVVSGQPGQS